MYVTRSNLRALCRIYASCSGWRYRYFHSKGESLFPEDMVALRVGRWKLVSYVGGLRDAHWHDPRP